MKQHFSIIGGGKVAQAMVRELCKAGLELQFFWNRTGNGTLDPSAYGGKRVETIEEVAQESNWVVIAVSDDAVATCARALEGTLALVTHTSGVLGLDSIPVSRAGVFYPLQTFNGPTLQSLVNVPFFVDATEQDDLLFLKNTARLLGGKAMELTQDQKEHLHLAAVFANNYTNQMLQIAAEICEENHIDFEVLRPLMERTVGNAFSTGPKNSQTGPAIRGDMQTLRKHLALLSDPELQEIYKLLSHRINTQNREL